jgi:hypothetical protein
MGLNFLHMPLAGQRVMSPNIWSASRHVSQAFYSKIQKMGGQTQCRPKREQTVLLELHSIENSPTNPKIWHQRQNAKAKPTIEIPPDWAFDVTGTYEIDASDLHHDISWFKREHGDNLPKFLMQIQYGNNPAHKRIGRQLWANFYWGDLHGCLRFCPGKG